LNKTLIVLLGPCCFDEERLLDVLPFWRFWSSYWCCPATSTDADPTWVENHNL